MSGVDSAQFAERTEQSLAGPAIKLQLLLVVLRAGQNLRRTGSLKLNKPTCLTFKKQEKKSALFGFV